MAEPDAFVDTFVHLYRLIHDHLREEVAGLSPRALTWVPGPDTSSISTLVIHLLGSEEEVVRIVRGLPSDRDRASEFSAHVQDPEELLRRIDETDRLLKEVGPQITGDDLATLRVRPSAVENRTPKTGLFWLLNSYGHAREHLTQLRLTKQLFVGDHGIDLSSDQVAERAGVEPAYVGRLVDVGILDRSPDGTFLEGDARRTRLVRGLEHAGLPLEEIVEAVGRGGLSFAFLDRPVYDRFAGLSGQSFREVSEREEVPLELLLVVRDAMGFAQADPDDPMREDELQLVPLISLQLARGVDAAGIEEWLRVYGDALRRISETEANLWYTQITLPQLAAGLNEAQMQELTAQWGDEFDPLMDRAVLAIYHAHQEHTWTEVLIEVVESALDRAGLRAKMRITPAICFMDISGFTDLTEQRGDEAAADLASRMAPLVTRTAERHGGKVVKHLGDGVMLHFGRAEDAVGATLEMVEAVTDAGLPPAHAGIDTGPVVFQGGDYFGRTVNLAARIMERAQPGQILVSDDVAGSVDRERFALSPIGRVELKGVPRPVGLHIVERG